ncbi:hypothetical protein Zm00014a_021708 [Zea mays]|nr:hypothetical protein Zm00014a_021705 [Zea mays]PWZ56749.1 hypothetical protein Zm00014a_021708 [Zea mays]
MDLSFI